MEGDMSMHNGYPSSANGFGCMDLVKNNHADTLDTAASLLQVNPSRVKNDMETNIRGGAAILRKDALHLSRNHTVPKTLAGWYGAVATYSNATNKPAAKMYANAVYSIINHGFTTTSDTGESITLTPQSVSPDKKSAHSLHIHETLPKGCVNDGITDYPGAIDCMLHPDSYDCNDVANTIPCTYEDANRPSDLPINFIVIHDVEGSLPFAFAVFHDPKSLVSIHYIVDTDGTVYQLVPEKDVAYHAGNYWYNQHAIGIEHTSYHASGFTWYSAGEYLGSARLSAYLAKKYTIPLDHDHIISHGTAPPPTLSNAPNHLDPGPYWRWDYYFALIHKQGVSYPAPNYHAHVISLHPRQNVTPFASNGTVYPAYFNFFYLYNGPGTKYSQIPSSSPWTANMDVSNNIESDISYYYLGKIADLAGSGYEFYHLWYGEFDKIPPPSIDSITTNKQSLLNFPLIPLIGASNDKPIITAENWFANAKLVWVSAPEDAVKKGNGRVVKLISPNGTAPVIYGVPISNSYYIIGNAPKGAIFVSGFTTDETDTQRLWYEINYNHRQAWVPASEISLR